MSQRFLIAKEAILAPQCIFSATLLKEVKIMLHLPDGSSWPVPISPNAKRVQLLACLAWKRNQPVYRRTIEQNVFLHGLPKEYATQKHLQDMFGAHTRLLRRDIREAIVKVYTETGESLLLPECDPLTNTRGGYWALSALWFPTDLEVVQSYVQFIDDVRERGRLDSGISDEVKTACDALLAAYSGDFLQEMIRTYPEEFQPLRTSWVREPHTFYRDCYLKALWYAGEYERQRWQSGAKETAKHAEQAIHYYWQYALSACQSTLDIKLDFASAALSERILMSERALRRCLVLYQTKGERDAFEKCYQDYCEQMEHLSQHRWQPTSETLQVVHSVPW